MKTQTPFSAHGLASVDLVYGFLSRRGRFQPIVNVEITPDKIRSISCTRRRGDSSETVHSHLHYDGITAEVIVAPPNKSQKDDLDQL